MSIFKIRTDQDLLFLTSDRSLLEAIAHPIRNTHLFLGGTHSVWGLNANIVHTIEHIKVN